LQVEISRFRAEWSRFESRQVQRIFSSLKRPDRLWGPPGPLHKEYCWIFKTVGVWGWPLTLHLASRLRMNGAAPPLPHTPLWRKQESFTSTSFEIFNGVASRVEKRRTRSGIRYCIAQK
jgi:hypothetical protein